jgi:hypothetical protein
MAEQQKQEQAKVVEEVGLTGGAAPQREHLTLDSARRVMLRPVRPDEDVDELFAAGHPPGVSTAYFRPSTLPIFFFADPLRLQTCGS